MIPSHQVSHLLAIHAAAQKDEHTAAQSALKKNHGWAVKAFLKDLAKRKRLPAVSVDDVARPVLGRTVGGEPLLDPGAKAAVSSLKRQLEGEVAILGTNETLSEEREGLDARTIRRGERARVRLCCAVLTLLAPRNAGAWRESCNGPLKSSQPGSSACARALSMARG